MSHTTTGQPSPYSGDDEPVTTNDELSRLTATKPMSVEDAMRAAKLLSTFYCLYCGSHLTSDTISLMNPQCCQVCYPRFCVRQEIVTRTDEEYRLMDDSIELKRHQCRRLTFDGKAWLNGAYAIANRTDAEIRTSIEVMRAQIMLMEDALLTRVIKRAKEQAALDASVKTLNVLARSLPRIPTIATTAKPATSEQGKTETIIKKLTARFKSAGITRKALEAMLASIEASEASKNDPNAS